MIKFIRKALGLRPSKPPLTVNRTVMGEPETRMAWIDGQWIEVCNFCGGNCGQCGTSIGRGVPASMQIMAENLGRSQS